MTGDGVLIVTAEARELGGILRRCRNRRRLRWPLECAWEGELGGALVWLTAGGHGRRLAKRAVEAALGRVRPVVVVSAGFCGALDPALAPGEVLVATRVQAVEDGVSYEIRSPRVAPPHSSGSLVTCDRVVGDVEEKGRLRATGWAAVDMEAAGVAAAASAAGVPFCAVKAVTDSASEPLRVDFEAARNGDGRIVVSRVLAGALRRPWTDVPELFWLYRRCRRAAERLGEFFDGCRF